MAATGISSKAQGVLFLFLSFAVSPLALVVVDDLFVGVSEEVNKNRQHRKRSWFLLTSKSEEKKNSSLSLGDVSVCFSLPGPRSFW